MQSSDYGWLNIRMGGEFYFLFQIEILKLTCLGVPREGEREKRRERARELLEKTLSPLLRI